MKKKPLRGKIPSPTAAALGGGKTNIENPKNLTGVSKKGKKKRMY